MSALTDKWRTAEEVAAAMTRLGFPMTRSRVLQIEERALGKIARDPVLRQYAADLGLDVGDERRTA